MTSVLAFVFIYHHYLQFGEGSSEFLDVHVHHEGLVCVLSGSMGPFLDFSLLQTDLQLVDHGHSLFGTRVGPKHKCQEGEDDQLSYHDICFRLIYRDTVNIRKSNFRIAIEDEYTLSYLSNFIFKEGTFLRIGLHFFQTLQARR